MEDKLKKDLKESLEKLMDENKSKELSDAIEYVINNELDERVEVYINFLVDKCKELNDKNKLLIETNELSMNITETAIHVNAKLKYYLKIITAAFLSFVAYVFGKKLL